MSRFYLKIFFVHNDEWWWPLTTIYTAQHNFCYDKLVVNFICWGFCAYLSSINKKNQNNSQLLSNLFRNIVNSLVLQLSLEMSSIFYIEVGNFKLAFLSRSGQGTYIYCPIQNVCTFEVNNKLVPSFLSFSYFGNVFGFLILRYVSLICVWYFCA